MCLELYCEVLGFCCCLGLVVGFCALVICFWWGVFCLVGFGFWFVCSLGFFAKKRRSEHFFPPLRGEILLQSFFSTTCHSAVSSCSAGYVLRYLSVCRAQRYSKKTCIQHNSTVALTHPNSCLCWCLLLCPTQNVLWGVV